jgi:hypothetical protein
MCVPDQVFIFAGVVLCHVFHYLAAGIVHQLYQHSYSAGKTQNDLTVTVLTAMRSDLFQLDRQLSRGRTLYTG